MSNKEKITNKKVKFSYTVPEKHWVGDGFFVHGLLRPSEEINRYISPFILMDYASPMEFPKTKQSKGVGEHPHRGFETVTLSYQGEIEHRDSSGGGGVIKEGDVQWMTAGRGIVHDEFHSKEFSSRGGVFEMVQLWVNLPKKDKMTEPKYQSIEKGNIPKVKIGENSELSIIAGEFEGVLGPASTFTVMSMYNLKSAGEDKVSLNFKTGTNTIILVMDGELTLDSKSYQSPYILILDQEGEKVSFTVGDNFKSLVLNGEPIDEPIVAHGLFVMNTKEEISEAIRDYQEGKMGKL